LFVLRANNQALLRKSVHIDHLFGVSTGFRASTAPNKKSEQALRLVRF